MKKVTKNIKNSIGNFSKDNNVSFKGSTLSTVMTLREMNSRMQQGESFWSAGARSMGTNIKYGLGGFKLLGLEGVAAATSAYPGVKRAAEEQKAFRQNYQNKILGGGYLDSENNMTNRARGMEQIKRNRMQLSQSLGNEAKRFHR